MLHQIERCHLKCNQAFLRSDSEQGYLLAVPKILVETGGYRFSWIGFKGKGEAKPVIPVSQEGFSPGYLSSIQISWADTPIGRGPTGMALRTGKPNRIQNILEDPRYEPWRAAARKHGYVSSAAFPIFLEGEAAACLNLYSAQKEGFSDEAMSLLEDLAEDISLCLERLRREEKLRAEKAHYQILFEEAPDGIFIADTNGRYLAVNQRGCEILGYDESELLQMNMTDLVVAGKESIQFKALFEGQELVSHRYLRSKSGAPVSVAISGKQLTDGRLLGIVRRIRDFGNSKAVYVKEISGGLSFRLPDRFVFKASVEQALKEGGPLVLAVLNIDGFRRINEAFGRKQGLRLLALIGERIRSELPERHLCAHAGADEYYILFYDLSSEEVETTIDGILKKIQEGIQIAGELLKLTASVGLAEATDTVKDTEILLNRAHTALSWAKKGGKGSRAWYAPHMEEEARRKIQMEAILTDAILHNDFEIYLQAKYAMPEKTVSGYEALLRLKHDGQILLPGSFISLAEETGLIHGIGGCFLQKLAGFIKELRQRGAQIPNIAINLSPVQFQRPKLPEEVAKLLELYELPSELLTIEITEGALFANPAHAIQMLRAFRELGFRIAIDDFGTGFSSLGAIRDYPFDSLKIDRSFIRNLFRSEKDNAIVATILQMGETLGVEVIAEGVETEEQLDFLLANGCKQVQGFLLHRPEPFESIHFALP